MLQHQISHSPARLGLTSPTSSSSPSLPSTNPPKFTTAASSSHQQPHHHPNLPSSSAAPATSSTLLSLLPPLPRAQSLLLQMSSLASKLFDVSPNRALWLSSFRGSLPSFLSSQPQSQPAQSHVALHDPPPSSTKEILSLFTSLQTQLFKAVAELQEILDLQDAKHKLAREIRSKDSALLSFANRLKDAERVLDVLVDDYADYRRPKRSRSASAMEEDGDDDLSSSTTVASRLNLSDIVSYAHRISYTTFAPPDFGAGQAPLRGALPPAPQDEQMRVSQLYSVDDIHLPKSAVQDDDKASISMVETLANMNVPAIPVLPPNIVVPSGWKPGMPVELPTDLPVPPPGWKPGDPITLPPIDTLPVRRPEEPQLQPAGLPGLHKEPETIQVRHVDLELPDTFDDSSDYSSDEASSEDDE
ncbi:mediator of RNA polymerase II transcription subunit 4 [Rhodamnia argentea]|uniref:Mediator of RNA polymerase II transcription subunit 4 n=1 Tax=Rhodamnia argentea TaxID=178133 RepID=A0A8B8NXJ6_9MYRT|nr:mediator of RNA polymerase II transcription subunit 4 [Rhodamnia argentea]